MYPKLRLVSHTLCPYVQRAVITLLEKEIPHERTYIDLANKPNWFIQMSPLGKVPLLIIEEEEVLFESMVICEYLEETTSPKLHPQDPLKKAQHRAWIEFGSNLLNTISGFYNAPDQKSFEQKRIDLIGKFSWLENNLSNFTYFAGEEFSMVDAIYGSIFRYFDVFEAIADFHFFTDTPKVKAWRQNLKVRPSTQAAVTPEYPKLLRDFIKQRNSYLSTLIQD